MNEVGTIRLGDMLCEAPEYGANASALPPDGLNPRYLRITDIDDAGRILHDDVKCIPMKVAEPYLLRQDDIVIARTGNTVGKSYIHDERNGCLAFAGYLIRFRLDREKGDPTFVFHYLHSPLYWAWIGNTIRTGAQPNVNASEYKQLPIPAFARAQQLKIANILTTVDRLIEKTEALIAKYQSIKQGMMHDLFTRGVDGHGHLRPTYDEAPHLYKKSKLGWIPKEWEQATVGEHLTRIEQGWSPDCEGEPACVGEWGILKTTAVVWEGYDYQGNKRLPVNLLPRPEYEVKAGDVLMTRGGPNSRVGVVAYAYETQTQLMISDKMYRLVPRGSIGSEFLALALSSDRTQTHLSKLKTGLAESQTNISQEIVRRLRIPFPAMQEQKRISSLIRRVNRLIVSERSHLTKLELQKTGLMQDLLTGKVRVKVDETEVNA